MKRLRSVGAVLVLAASGVLLAAGPASAAQAPAAAAAQPPAVVTSPPWWHPKDTGGASPCATAPDVDAPVAGAPGSATPDQQRGNDVSLWQRYGFAGMHWFTYDLGWDAGGGAIGGGASTCVPNGEALGAASQTELGNFFFQGAKNIVSLDDMVLRLAYTSGWLSAFDPFIVRAVTSLHDSVFSVWSAVALAILGLAIIVKAYKGSLTSALTRGGSAVLVFTAAYVIFTQPLFLTHTFAEQIDQNTGKLASSITGQTVTTTAGPDGCWMAAQTGCSMPLPADVMIASLHKTMIYRVWLEGVFGDADSKTAQTYGPQVLAATAMTKAEVATRGTPEFAKIAEKKQADFTAVAAQVKAQDPVAYSYLQGKHADERGSKAMRAIIGAGGASLVVLAASLAMMMAKLMAIFVLVGSMVFLVAAIVRGDFGVAQLDRVAAAAVTALVWSTALPISMLLNDAALNNPQLSPAMSALILIVINGLIFMAALAIAPGFSGVLRKKHARQSGRLLMAAVQVAAGFFGARTGAASPPPPAGPAPQPVPQPVPTVTATPYPPPPPPPPPAGPAIPSSATRALPDAPVAPDATETASERDERTLPPEPRRAPEAEPQPGGEEYRPTRTEGTSTVYDIYSGRRAPEDESPVRDDEPVSGEVLSDSEDGGRLAIDSGSSGGTE